MARARLLPVLAVLATSFPLITLASDPPAPVITNINVSGSQRGLRFAPYPAASNYAIFSGTNASIPLTLDTNFFLAPFIISAATNGTNYGYEWRATNNAGPNGIYSVRVTPMSSNALFAANVLNRLTYGPTPDEVERINSIGPDAYVAEQLAPWTITEDVSGTHTNFARIEPKFADATNFVWRTNAGIADLRAWHVLRAVGAKRQLLEILLQFLENHFVTQWTKSETVYFPTYYNDGTYEDALAAQLEYRENVNWRNALLNPTCTFYDLLKICCESPAMIIYLDTYSSKGNGSNIANENFAREIMELFCMGVDNGYDQNDITIQSRIWTGWGLEKVDLANVYNPFSLMTTNIIPGSTNTSLTRSNLYGAWAFHYNQTNHNNSTKVIFTNKFIPSRFGLPWTIRTYYTNTVPGKYQIAIAGHSTTDTNGIYEGYQFITNLANYPFVQEYISIKLCRLLISDNFPNPSNDTNSDSYAFYNYAGGNLSPEADLVHQCMLTWETNSPKGQIWKVLKTITDSDLFRSHGGSMQKVKTPLEYAVSTVRALRSTTNGSNLAGSFTAFTDGYNISGSSSAAACILSRAGNMLLFDRDSPDGYPEMGPPWVSAGTLAERIRFSQSFCIALGQAAHTGTSTNDAGSNTVCDVVGLLRAKTPASSWTNAGAVADYFLSILYPAEGGGNLSLYRSAAINYLNTDDNSANSPFTTLPVNNTPGQPYDNRVRGMVGMLMTMQRFQEQ